MGFGNKNAIKAGSLEVDKSKVDVVKKERRRCWFRFSCVGCCIPSRSKLDRSICCNGNTSTQNGNFVFHMILFVRFRNYVPFDIN